MKFIFATLLYFVCTSAVLLAQSTPQPVPAVPKIASIPIGMLVEMKMSTPQGQADASGNPAKQTSVFIYKSHNSRIAIREWPSGRTTYDITVAGWQFTTDPTVPEKYKDFVQVIPTSPNASPVADFPEISFASESAAKVEEVKLNGQPTWILTGKERATRYTEQYLKSIEGQVAPGEREEIMNNLRMAQKAEAAGGPQKPPRLWIDVASRLPIRMEGDGMDITYTYKASSPPVLPTFLRQEIAKKIGDKSL